MLQAQSQRPKTYKNAVGPNMQISRKGNHHHGDEQEILPIATQPIASTSIISYNQNQLLVNNLPRSR